MKYYAPKTIVETLSLIDSLGGEDVTLLAGGTDVIPRMNCRPERSGWVDPDHPSQFPRGLIYLGNIGLDYIKEQDGAIHIGACMTLTSILENEITKRVPVLVSALENLAGLTVRNMATIGGNIMNASPAADSIPALLVSATKVVLIGKAGERMIDLDELFVGPGKTAIASDEILKEIIVQGFTGKTKFIKFGRRKAESLSIVNGAGRAVVSNGICEKIYLSVGAVAPTPLRLKGAEAVLEGQVISDELIAEATEKALEKISPIDDVRSSADYRKKLSKVLFRRLIEGICR